MDKETFTRTCEIWVMRSQDSMRGDRWNVSAWLLEPDASHAQVSQGGRQESYSALIGGTHAMLEPWSGHDGSAAEHSQDPAYGCGSATRFEQVTKSFDGICVGT